MNAVEIEEEVFSLACKPFDSASFPYAFLEAFGFPSTTLKRLISGKTNKSDLGGVLLRNNIHILICNKGEVTKNLVSLKKSPANINSKVKFILVTDGENFEAENLESGEIIVCEYSHFSNYFGFFLPLAGISTVKEISDLLTLEI